MDKNVGASVLARAPAGMFLFSGFAPLPDSYQGMPSGIPQAEMSLALAAAALLLQPHSPVGSS